MMLVEVEGFKFSPTFALRVQYVLRKMRQHPGVTISINEGYRPDGVYADQFVKNARDTSTKGPNQWFYIGEMKRGGNYAAPAGTSDHRLGEAVDWDTNNMALRDYYMAEAGLWRNTPSETWHAAVKGTPPVGWAALTVAQEEEDIMAKFTDAEKARFIAVQEATRGAQTLPHGKWTYDQEILQKVDKLLDLTVKLADANVTLSQKLGEALEDIDELTKKVGK